MTTKEKLKAGESVMMVKVAYQDPAIYEMVGLLGFDCVWICNEHIGIDPSKMDSIIRACRLSGMDAVVRIKPANYMPMLHVLEFGAKGIMIPRASGPEEVRQIVRDMKMEYAETLEEALAMARETVGKTGTVTVIPNGISVIVNKE